MKYTCEIEINQPLEKVIALFDNPDNLTKWMDGLISFEPISGIPGQPGAKSKLKFDMGKRGKMEMIETILVRNLPHEFKGSYEAKGVFNIVKASFVSISENKTNYISEQEFKLKGFMKIIGFLIPGAFRKETMKYMNSFKKFAESQS